MRFPKMTILGALAACLALCVDTAIAQKTNENPNSAKEAGTSDPFGGGNTTESVDDVSIVRVYNVSDLIATPPNYPYQPGLPTTAEPAATSVLGGAGLGGGLGGGGGGFGGSGQGGGGGAGFFAVPTTGSPSDAVATVHHQMGGGGGFAGPPVDNSEMLLNELVDLLMETVGSNWGGDDSNGWQYDIRLFKQMLVVRQTNEVHKQIEAFLKDLRKQSGSSTMLTVQVHWVPIESGQTLADFQEATQSRTPSTNPEDQTIARDFIDEHLARASYQGQITCHNGQTVHLTSGARRMVIRGATPSVGFGSAAYTPEVTYPHIGTIVQVKPSLNAEQNTVSLDIWSTVTGWDEPGEPVQIAAEFNRVKSDQGETGGGKAQAVIDRINMPTQHLATSIRVPLDTPTIVGTLTTNQSADTGEKSSSKQLVMVVHVTANETN
ncbi:hypothetical protein [Thalassoroseus pseudoceratinae]|uniref:hypothetical protein n=1 Tax=Thalassoroseus pseudoceratinae TaxID=2713176 RepID=UPI0014222FB5|nr:hypothetical protein [Thalassoroseus pseudoceratinae]